MWQRFSVSKRYTITRACAFPARAADRQQSVLLPLSCPISRSTGETIFWAEGVLHLLLLLLEEEKQEVLVLLQVQGINGRLADTRLTHAHNHSLTHTHWPKQADGVSTGCSEHPHLAGLSLKERRVREGEREMEGWRRGHHEASCVNVPRVILAAYPPAAPGWLRPLC